MDVKKIVLLIGALVVAAVTAVMARNMFTGAGAPSASATAVVPAGPEVLVSTRALPVGTIIDAEALRYQAWPEGLVQNAYYIKGEAAVNPADLLGTVVRTEITAGQPISQGAITVAVSATSGVAGFVFPGDRIDLVLTQEVPGGGDGPPLRASETIIRNIRVLATDQRMNVRNEEGKPVVKSVSTVTLEATPKIAEKIAVAQTIGQLSLSLRSLADNSAELEMAIASGEVEVPEGDDPNAEKRLLLAVAAKPTDKNTTYTLGADVSRFQRSTAPSKAASTDGTGGAAVAGVPAAVPVGPIVRVARGNTVTVVPVGAK